VEDERGWMSRIMGAAWVRNFEKFPAFGANDTTSLGRADQRVGRFSTVYIACEGLTENG
jgi:hypothetical protein